MHFGPDRGAGRTNYYDLKRTETLKDPLKRFLKTSGVGWMLKHQDLVAFWAEAAGDAIAADTRVRGLRGGVLHVDVYSPARKAELEQFGGATLVRVLSEHMPAASIRSIRFHLAERPVPPSGGRAAEDER